MAALSDGKSVKRDIGARGNGRSHRRDDSGVGNVVRRESQDDAVKCVAQVAGR